MHSVKDTAGTIAVSLSICPWDHVLCLFVEVIPLHVAGAKPPITVTTARSEENAPKLGSQLLHFASFYYHAVLALPWLESTYGIPGTTYCSYRTGYNWLLPLVFTQEHCNYSKLLRLQHRGQIVDNNSNCNQWICLIKSHQFPLAIFWSLLSWHLLLHHEFSIRQQQAFCCKDDNGWQQRDRLYIRRLFLYQQQ